MKEGVKMIDEEQQKKSDYLYMEYLKKDIEEVADYYDNLYEQQIDDYFDSFGQNVSE